MVKKVLITGNSGYIGSHLTKMLKDEYEVYGLDKVEPQEAPHTFYHCDINRQFNLEDEFDCVIHLAALVNVGESEQKPIPYYITNLNGTMNVLNKIKTKNFIFASTGATQDTNNNFQFNAIDKDKYYDYVFCLGITPDSIYFDIVSKAWIKKNLTTRMTKADGGYKMTKPLHKLYELNEVNLRNIIERLKKNDK